MKTFILFLCVLLTGIGNAAAQGFTDSNLPIVIINTAAGAPIADEPKVEADMKIIFRGPGQRNFMTDQNNAAYLNYNGKIAIELRGSSSQATNKKGYGFTTRHSDGITNDNVSLLGMPSENDWVLNGMVWDPALIRDYLCYNLSRQIGEYASRTAYCEVVINGTYKGLYLLQEKIKADDNRVNVTKIDIGDNAIPAVTGGYITKADKTTGGDPVAWSMWTWTGGSVAFIHELPKPENVTASQNGYIKGQFTALDNSALIQDASPVYGYPAVIDVMSFIDYMIISELSSNADSYMYSTYFHKDRNGKLRAGPVWDNDLTFGNDLFIWGFDRSHTDIWQFSNGDNEGPRFWRNLFNEPQFRCCLAKRWNALTRPGEPINPVTLSTFIDRTAADIREAVVRDNSLWGHQGDQAQRISEIKTFVNNRVLWMTGNLGSFAACSDVVLPPLVITKIMYHPEASLIYPDNDDLEYIEITNTSDQRTDLTGIFFAGTGLVFQFPPNSFIGPQSSVYIAANSTAFISRYGISPFGEYTRHLSNKGQDVVLSDAYGNVIDYVSYSDTVPWPEADGNGSYLKLIDSGLDNNDPANWIASNEVITSSDGPFAGGNIKVYPNPVRDILNIYSGDEITTVKLYDIYGRLLETVTANCQSLEMNVEFLAEGIYFVRIETAGKVIVRRIIKGL